MVLSLQGEVKGSYESTVRRLSGEGSFQVAVTVRQVEGDEQPLVLEFEGKREEFNGEGTFRFSVPETDLDVGSNPMHALVRTAAEGGEPIARIPLDLYLDYRLGEFETKLAPGKTKLELALEVPDGATLEVEGAEVTGDGGQRTITVDLVKALGQLSALTEAKQTVPLKLTLTVGEGEKHADTLSVQVVLPQTELKVYAPAQLLAGRSRVQLEGYIHPDAVVTLNGKDTEMYEDGDFEATATLKSGEQTLRLVASQQGYVSRAQEISVERLSAAELRARRKATGEEAGVWAERATDAPESAALLAGAEGDLKGKAFKLSGRVGHILAAGDSTVVVLQTCRGGCPVLVRTKAPLDLEVKDRATAYGTLTGKGEFKAARGEEAQQVPQLDAIYLIGS